MTRLQGLLLNVVARRLSGAEVASLQEAFQRLVCPAHCNCSLEQSGGFSEGRPLMLL